EAGVGCVTLGYGGWDKHSENFTTLRRQLPDLDRGIANLIQDLHDRGMGEDVVTVVWGEFGRTPRIGDSTPEVRGRGGVWGVGLGVAPARRGGGGGRRPPPPPGRGFHSTVYRALGIDAAQT